MGDLFGFHPGDHHRKNLKVDQLFLNGKRQVLARYPNYDGTKILDGHAADCIDASRVGKWADPTEGPGYIRAMHDSQWGGNDFIITGKSGTTVTYKWVGDNNRGRGNARQLPHGREHLRGAGRCRRVVLQEVHGAALFLAAIGNRSHQRDHRARVARRASQIGRDIGDGDGSVPHLSRVSPSLIRTVLSSAKPTSPCYKETGPSLALARCS